jgi:hypothetical protein
MSRTDFSRHASENSQFLDLIDVRLMQGACGEDVSGVQSGRMVVRRVFSTEADDPGTRPAAKQPWQYCMHFLRF